MGIPAGFYSTTVNLRLKDKIANPIDGAVYKDNVLLGTSTSGSYNAFAIGANRTFLLKIVPSNPSFRTFEQVVTLPPAQSFANLTIVFLATSDNGAFCNPYVAIGGCSSMVSVTNFVAGLPQTDNVDWGDGSSSLGNGESLVHAYHKARTYEVEMVATFCQNDETIPCVTCTSDFDIVMPTFSPSAYFLLQCNTTSDNFAYLDSPCMNGCVDCDCEDQAMCRCVPKNKHVTLVPFIRPNLADCPVKTFVVTWYSNTTQIATVTLDEDDDIDNLDLVFDVEGTYNIMQQVTTCCGVCQSTETIHVGPPVRLTRTACNNFTLDDFTPYEEAQRLRININRVDGKLVQTYLYEAHGTGFDSGDSHPISFPSDGVYVVSASILDDTGTVLSQNRWTIYEFCTVIACFRRLADGILCPECGCDEKKQRELRDKVRDFLLLAGAYYASLDTQLGTTHGMLTYKEDYLSTLKNHELLLRGLTKLCGDCSSTTTSGLPDCTNCG